MIKFLKQCRTNNDQLSETSSVFSDTSSAYSEQVVARNRNEEHRFPMNNHHRYPDTTFPSEGFSGGFQPQRHSGYQPKRNQGYPMRPARNHRGYYRDQNRFY